MLGSRKSNGHNTEASVGSVLGLSVTRLQLPASSLPKASGAPFAYDFFKRHIPLVESSISPLVSSTNQFLLVTHLHFSLSPQPSISRKRNPRRAARLIATLRLEIPVTHSKQIPAAISNRRETAPHANPLWYRAGQSSKSRSRLRRGCGGRALGQDRYGITGPVAAQDTAFLPEPPTQVENRPTL